MTSSSDKTPARRWLIFLLVVAASVVLLLLVPRGASLLLFLALIAGTVVLVLRATNTTVGDLYRRLRVFTRQHDAEPSLELPTASRRRLTLEIIFVVLIACLATHEFLIDDPTQTLGGGEVDGDVHTAYFAAITFRDKGYIPLWNPWLEFGHPVINNAKSIILNPFSTGPPLLFGGVRGIKLGVVLSAILAGVGGWFLGRVLGLQVLGRILLGLLLIGKGNMLAMIGAGYYPLGTSQAYFPWVIAGTVGIVRLPRERWPVGLTALALVLMFWAGNIWYTLPLIFNVGLLVLFHWRRTLARMMVMAAFAVGLGAVSLIPIWVEQPYMGDHPDERAAGRVVDGVHVIEQFVNGSVEPYINGQSPGAAHFYYSYIAPLWFVVALFILVPLLWPPNVPQPALPHLKLIWAVGLFMIAFCTIWGAGGNPLFIWMYEHVPLLGQWRFVGRALAVASFWIAILVALRVDSLWRATFSLAWTNFPPRWHYRLAGVLVALCALAAYDVIRQWDTMTGTVSLDYWASDDTCLNQLRTKHPSPEPLAVYRYGYVALVPYLNHEVRETTLEFDFEPQPMPSTLTRSNLLRPQAEYGIAVSAFEREVLQGWGYEPVAGSACLWHQLDTLSYAYTVPLATLRSPSSQLTTASTIPITEFERNYDRIRLWVQPQGNDAQVVTVQELAYPGWEVWVDGRPAKLEVAGGFIAVVLPPDNTRREVYFRYRPPLVFEGGKITLMTSVLLVLYLLRLDQQVGRLLNLGSRRKTQFSNDEP